MPIAKKPAFEGFRAQLISNGRPLAEKDIVPIQAAIVAQLDTIREILVQKTKRLSHKDGIIEITTTWVGLDASAKAVIDTFKRNWPADVFAGAEDSFYVGESDEAILLQFAAKYPEGRYITGKILVTI